LDLIVQTGYSPPGDSPVEVVERKGIGHPDTICDALAEEISRALCCAYLETFGVILHHNVDKILLCGGAAQPAFGGGEVLEPIEFYLGGRATEELDGQRIPVIDIAVEACRAWLRTHLPELDLDRHVRIIPRFRPGSGALRGLFSKGQHALGERVALSNDSSCGAGFAPFTPLEQIVLEVERTLNSAETKRTHPAIGQDIKVLGVRNGLKIHLTISCAMIGRYLAGVAGYISTKTAARELALTAASRIASTEIDAVVNAADDIERGDIFLTVTGTSAESGDDGEVGRGNRVSGLITPYRSMTMEAAAGKNPVSHVGKLYSLVATVISDRIVASVAGVDSASCLLASQIGRPIDDPQIVDIRFKLPSGDRSPSSIESIRQIVQQELHQFEKYQAELLAGRLLVY